MVDSPVVESPVVDSPMVDSPMVDTPARSSGDGGDGSRPSGRLHTPESRAKISAANKGRLPWNTGRQHSEETRRRIAEGTRLAAKRKQEAARRERERLRDEEPEVYAKLVAEEEARAAASAARAVERARHRNELARLRRREKREALLLQKAEANGTAVHRANVTTGGGRVNFTFSKEVSAPARHGASTALRKARRRADAPARKRPRARA